MKYVNSASGFGSRILRSDAELDDFLQTEPRDQSKFIVQHCIVGPVEYVTHCVCKGRPHPRSRTFAFENEIGEEIRRGIVFKSMTAVAAPEGALAAIERLLLPLAYDGPCSVDYTRGPRTVGLRSSRSRALGGTLMLVSNVPYLQQALTASSTTPARRLSGTY